MRDFYGDIFLREMKEKKTFDRYDFGITEIYSLPWPNPHLRQHLFLSKLRRYL